MEISFYMSNATSTDLGARVHWVLMHCTYHIQDLGQNEAKDTVGLVEVSRNLIRYGKKMITIPEVV